MLNGGPGHKTATDAAGRGEGEWCSGYTSNAR